jgi:hypothetical protein
VRGKFIGCVVLTKKDTKQAVRFCDAVNVVSVQPTDKPEDVLALITVASVKVAGNEANPTNRKAAIDQATNALIVLKVMRTPAKDQDDVAGRRLAGKEEGGKGKSGGKRRVPEKAGDKRKKRKSYEPVKNNVRPKMRRHLRTTWSPKDILHLWRRTTRKMVQHR